MPFLDVTDVLDDLDLIDMFTVVRATEQRNNKGRAVASAPNTVGNVEGSVQPNAGRSLQRLDASERVTDAITIYTTYRLTTGTGPNEADQVLWNGGTYVVVNVRDFSRYGAGYIEAVCDLTDINLP